MKKAAVFILVIAAAGCSPGSKSGGGWSASWGVATPVVLESPVSNSAPVTIDEAEKATPFPKKESHPSAQTFCMRGDDRRALAMIRRGTGCQLSYRNRSSVEIAAKATWGKRVCEQVRSRIVQKLKSAGYSCS